MHYVKTKNWHFYTGKSIGSSGTKDSLVFAGRANPLLTDSVFKYLGINPSGMNLGNFADGEVCIELLDDVSNKDVYVIQSVCKSTEHIEGGQKRSVNDALMELLLLVSACRRASCRTITAVLPYYAYARQDRKMGGSVPISAADVAHLLTGMGATRVVCVDLHCGQIQGFFPPTVPVDNVGAGPVGAAYFSEKDLTKPVVVSPDAGGLKRAKDFRGTLERKGYAGKTGLAVFVKQRAAASQIESMDLVGSVQGCDCILVDDMIDTGGTLCKAAELLKQHGARRVFAFCTHGLFNDPAYKRVSASCIEELVVTNSVTLNKQPVPPNVSVLDLAPIVAEIIRRLIVREPISEVYKNTKKSKL